ncbi:hypothetical protein [Rhizobium leucaenae]|uniref:Uncharacterized protein n=1 Tax=Rhizobium leucaenae TaxID=29450 RepID=A0A7W6ZXX8_9HYPH|nr:hypothetical protein [Rhizobium leucaenae]MBB4570786.1 hypothetical protein [Rhizobium leucaenae]MBB6303672.1 hypothetical protein [Rhizobium leucaenae]
MQELSQGTKKIAVMGAGLIGTRHIEGDATRANGLPWFANLAEVLERSRRFSALVRYIRRGSGHEAGDHAAS